jgi:hypothetical protein
MSKYLEGATEWLRWLEVRMAKTDNRRHQAIIRDFVSHLALEMCGDWQTVWGQMLVEEPVFHVYAPAQGLDKLTTYSGRQAVKELYANKGTAISQAYGPLECSFEVFDWGLVTFITGTVLLDGETMMQFGFDVEDADARYALEVPVVMRWWYDEDVRLIGEDDYQLAEPAFSRLDPADDFTLEQQLAALKPFCPR